jgi:hypothetical protein
MSAELVTAYEAMPPGERRSVTLVNYVCGHEDSCLLVTVWQYRGEQCWYSPGYRLSEQTAATETVASARAKRTTDGLRRWRAGAGYISGLIDDDNGEPIPEVGIALNCKHIRNGELWAVDLVAALKTATPGKPRRIVIPTHRTR